MNPKVSKRLSYWFTYSVTFALFPLAASITLHYLAGKSLYPALVNSPEVLFFAIITTSTALGDITDITPTKETDGLCRMFRLFLMVGAIISTFLYGVFLHETIIGSDTEGLYDRLLNISLPISIMFFIVGTVVQIFIGSYEEDSKESKESKEAKSTDEQEKPENSTKEPI